MDDVTAGLIVLIKENGERAVIAGLERYCAWREQDALAVGNDDSDKAWAKLAYRLRGALDGMKRGQFGRVR